MRYGVSHLSASRVRPLFHIKICGVQSAKDTQLIALAGADAVGFNFHPASPRYVSPDAVAPFAASISPKLARVGVFVNMPPGEMVAIADRIGLHWIQLHGDEPVEVLRELKGRSVIRAIRLSDSGWEPVTRYLTDCERLGVLPSALLIDAYRPDAYGGTGKTVDWGTVAANRASLGELPLILAGGLTPFNVSEAIGLVRPTAVDVASGVESKPGSKDLMLIRAFVTAAKKGLG